MPDDNTIDLPSVVQRFRESGDALEALREKVRALTLADETQSRAASSMEEAAHDLRELLGRIDSTVAELSVASEQVRGAMEAARAFLEGTDLSLVKSRLDDVAENVTALLSSVATDREALTAALGAWRQQSETATAAIQASIDAVAQRLDAEVDDARSRASAAEDALRALESRVAAVPEKHRRKFGLERS